MSDPGPTPPRPPSSPTFAPLFGTFLRGKWQRAFRLGQEFVGAGDVLMRPDAVHVTGRRSTLLRAGARLCARVVLWAGAAAAWSAMLLTGVGLTWRTEQLFWLAIALSIGPVVVLVTAGVLSWLIGRMLEPKVSATILWQDVISVASDGATLEIQFKDRSGTLSGLLAPKRPSASTRKALAMIRAGSVPHSAVATRHLRNPWIDRAVMVSAASIAVAVGVWIGEPIASSWNLLRGLPGTGPLAGVPDELTPEQIEARSPGCAAPQHDSPAMTTRREGADLVWSLASAQHWQPVHYKVEPGTSRVTRVEAPAATSGRLAGFFTGPGPIAGLTVLVRSRDVPALEAWTAHGSLDAVASAICSGVAARYDISLPLEAPPSVTVVATREDDDLLIEVSGLNREGWILPVRHRNGPGPDVTDWCEVPQERGVVGVRPATPLRQTIPGFFVEPDDEADIYLLDDASRHAAERLGREGTLQRCIVPMMLGYASAAVVHATTADTEVAAEWRARAMRIASTVPFPVAPDAPDVERWILDRHRAVREHVQPPADAREAVTEGFLDSIPWSLILDHFSFARSIGRVERVRQALNGADPVGIAGDRYLIRFAEEFLARNPPSGGSYAKRVWVGRSWLDVRSGTSWTVDDRPVIADEHAKARLELVGRFVLMDAARHLEDALDAGTLTRLGRADALAAEVMLSVYDITIDAQTPTSHKLLRAWVTGDFEYIFDRLTKKAAEALTNQDAAVQALRASRIALRTTWANGGTVRASDLLRDRVAIGWVAQFDLARSAARFHLFPQGGATQVGLGSPVLATAGSYMNGDGKTTGLAVVDGVVQNFLVSPKMDGLVVMWNDERGAHLEIVDLRRGASLPSMERAIRPLRSLRDFTDLTTWLRERKASAFQTHLLMGDGVPRLDPERASNERRERRLLARAHYRGHPIAAVVDLPSSGTGYTLFEAMILARAALDTPEPDGPGLEVVAIANLDVGSYDVLRAWSQSGEVLREGRVDLSVARNLITLTEARATAR